MRRWFPDHRCLFAASLIFSAVLGYFAQLPLWHTDLWGHLSFGRLIWESGALPEQEPFLLLADERALVDTAWLSQLILYATEYQFGVGGLQFGFGLVIAFICTIFFVAGYRVTGHLLACLVGTGLLLWLEWVQIEIIRPQLAGTALFVLLLCRFQFPPRRDLLWWLPPILVFWANLHGSFIMGVGLTGAWFLAMVIDSIRTERNLTRWIACPDILLTGLLLVVAMLVPLINPYGIGLYKDVVTFSNNPNLYDLVEWQPLTLKMQQGRSALVVSLILIFLWRRNRNAISTYHLLLLVVLGIATLLNSRMIVWWAPVAAMETVRQLEGYWGDWCRWKSESDLNSPRALWTALGLLIASGTLVVTAGTRSDARVGDAIRDGQIRSDLRQAVSDQTPLELTHFLHQKLASAEKPYRMLNSMVWGDFLIYALDGRQPVFVYSHVHITPRDVWLEYRNLLQLRAVWLARLDERKIDLIVLDRRQHRAACAGLRTSPRWNEIYADARGAIFERATDAQAD
ncbi:MAG: hypothetical protein CMJ46_03805 [Planctomyces sp.]|nr:hypothetical protein [Planctomyces sp.]